MLPVDICSTENALISVDQLEGLTWLHFGDMLHMDFVSGRSTAECSSPKSELAWPDIDEEDEGDIYDVDEEDDDEEDDEMLIIGSLQLAPSLCLRSTFLLSRCPAQQQPLIRPTRNWQNNPRT